MPAELLPRMRQRAWRPAVVRDVPAPCGTRGCVIQGARREAAERHADGCGRGRGMGRVPGRGGEPPYHHRAFGANAMAGQVEASGPVTLVEEATHLLRRASLETLLCHWIGSVPFAVALLVFWRQLTHPPLSDAACAAESLGLALLLVWMNCWRSVFTGRLYRDLSGAVDTPWTGKRGWRLIANQAFLGATKLVVLPIALLSVFPLANVVAFYRSVPVLADRQDLNPFGLVAKARRIAARGTAQCWLLQFLLVLFGMVAM